jgi:hypothetical protein
VYTFNDVSTYYMFRNKLNFKLKVYDTFSRNYGYHTSSSAYIKIFLMASNHNIIFGDMYYIRLQNDYYNNYLQSCELKKCTSDYGRRITIQEEFERFGCVSIGNYVSMSVNFKLWINLIFPLLEVICPDEFIT